MHTTTPKDMLKFFIKVQKDGHLYGSTPAAIRRLLEDLVEKPKQPLVEYDGTRLVKTKVLELTGCRIDDEDANEIIAALSCVPPAVEPVAWRWQWKSDHFHPTGETWMIASKAPAFDPNKRVECLYAIPSTDLREENERQPMKLEISKEWFEKRAAREGDLEIGVGTRKTMTLNLTPDEIATLESLLPRQAEIVTLREENAALTKEVERVKGLVDRAQNIVSTSTYPTWHEDARAALAREGK